VKEEAVMMGHIIEEFKGLSTTCISDAMDGLNNMDPAIKPVKADLVLAGRAHTVKLRAGDNLIVWKAISDAAPGDILVIDAKGYMYNASCGDFVVALAKTMGIAGIVVDGVVRDLAGIQSLDYPVFCRGTTVAAGGKGGAGEVGVSISCGGAVVRPGDIIVGDMDGVVVVPREIEAEVLRKAKLKLAKDMERERTALAGREAAVRYLQEVLKKV
jgi:4-hydroxy-4-methyl-2-oxoglutarate aldolase